MFVLIKVIKLYIAVSAGRSVHPVLTLVDDFIWQDINLSFTYLDLEK